jgi:hypothetical protein
MAKRNRVSGHYQSPDLLTNGAPVPPEPRTLANLQIAQ